jgi:hypothetical protein
VPTGDTRVVDTSLERLQAAEADARTRKMHPERNLLTIMTDTSTPNLSGKRRASPAKRFGRGFALGIG